MDFDTGRGSEGPDDRSLYGGEVGGPQREEPRRLTRNDFDTSDLVGNFVDTTRRVSLEPAAFFRSIPQQGNFSGPLLFSIVCYEIEALVGGLIMLVIDPLFGVQTFGETAFLLVVTLILTPIIVAVFSFVTAAILHFLTLLIVRPTFTGFEATFRANAYASVSVLVAIPFYLIPLVGPWLGTLVATIPYVILAALGIRELHGTTTGRAVAVVLIPTGLIVGLIVLAILLPVFLSARQA